MNREAREKQHLIETLYIRDKKNTAQGKEKRKKEEKRFFRRRQKRRRLRRRRRKQTTGGQEQNCASISIFFFLASKRVEFHSFPHPETTILSINNRLNVTHNSNTIHTDTTLNKNLR